MAKRVFAQERIGERKRMNNGQWAVILEITGKRDTTALYKVQFEDGAVTDGVQYGSFKRGQVSHPKDKATSAKDRIGECKKMNNGMYATILEVTGKSRNNTALFKVLFDDGAVRDGVTYSEFKKGSILHPNDKVSARVGERRKMSNGMYATIIEIGNASNHDNMYKVQFDDGVVRDGITYNNFKKGYVGHPNKKVLLAQAKIGERIRMNNGMYATIIEIAGKGRNGKTLCKIKFEDGTVRDGICYSQFKQGKVAHPKRLASGKIGECCEMNNGMQATIIEITGKSAHNETLFKIQFEDGAVVDGVGYERFKRGEVAHPIFRPYAPHGEREIAQVLSKVGFPFVWEYTADWLKDSRGNKFMDFFVPDLNLFIEFHGQQHFEYVPFFHDSGNRGYTGLPAFWEEKAIDDFKWKACREHGCDVWYFADDEPYTEDYRYPVHKLSELVDMLYDRMGVPAVG